MIPQMIVIPEKIELELQHIANHSENEECALLFGSESNETVHVDNFNQLTNLDESPVSFLMDSNEIIKAIQSNQNDVVGVWHSHPQGMPYPSSKDFDYMANMPFVWTIYSKKQETSKSFFRTDWKGWCVAKPIKTMITRNCLE